MEIENNTVETQQAEVQKSPLNCVTPLSKYLAMALFIAMPFIGGWIGYTYAPEKVVEVERVVNSDVTSLPVTEAKVFRSPLIQGGDARQGLSSLVFELSYPESEFIISYLSDISQIVITEMATGKISTINISNEEGRGMSPRDYWDHILAPSCSTQCGSIASPLVIKDAYQMESYTDNDKKWIIFSSPYGSPWLFVAELPKQSEKVEEILSTFTFVQDKIGN